MSFRRTALVAAAKTGSAALTIWPKETAPAPKASTEKAWAREAHRPTGRSSFQFAFSFKVCNELQLNVC